MAKPGNITPNEYATRDDYHSQLRLAVKWLPRYFRRYHVAEYLLNNHCHPREKILDLGCGEGVFVNRLRELGFKNAFGLDYNAPFMCRSLIRGDILTLPIGNDNLDVVICFDLLEHIPLHLQNNAAKEISRVLKSGGIALISVPNMAHLRSRISFLLKGRPWRNKLEKHPGELTIHERLEILKQADLNLGDWLGLHLTLTYNPTPKGILGRLATRIMFHYLWPPALCWTNVILMYKNQKPEWLNYIKRKESPFTKAIMSYKPPEKDPTFEVFRN